MSTSDIASNYDQPWNFWTLFHESSLKEIPRPDWLSKDALQGAIPLTDILVNSVYYPGSGTDGDPIEHLGRYFWSFVYVDYGFSPDSFRDAIQTGIKSSLRLLGHRAVTEDELPLMRWKSEIGDQFAYGHRREDNKCFYARGECPFAEWALVEDASVRPRRISSLLFIGADGVSLLEKVFVERGFSPACVCVVQAPPSMGGFNWTNFKDERSDLYRTLQRSVAGMPPFLLYGGSGDPEWYKKSCWSQYQLRLAWPLRRMREWRRDGALSLWENKPNPSIEPTGDTRANDFG